MRSSAGKDSRAWIVSWGEDIEGVSHAYHGEDIVENKGDEDLYRCYVTVEGPSDTDGRSHLSRGIG